MSLLSFSLRPSWDRMYASGMTVQEIADFTGRARSTVHRHLQLRERSRGDLLVVHDAPGRLAAPTGYPRAGSTCTRKSKTNGRLTTVDGDEAERDLETWLRSQRTLHRRGALSPIRITLMDMIPDWDVTLPRTGLDDHWRDRLHDLVAFVAESGEMPRYKKYSDEREHVLGVWLHIQHQARAEGRLLSWWLEALDSNLSSWQ